MQFYVPIAAELKGKRNQVGQGSGMVEVRDVTSAEAPVCVKGTGVASGPSTVGDVLYRNFDDRFWRRANYQINDEERFTRRQGLLRPLVSNKRVVRSLYKRADPQLRPSPEDIERSPALAAARFLADHSLIVEGEFYYESCGPVLKANAFGMGDVTDFGWRLGENPFTAPVQRLLAFGMGDEEIAAHVVEKVGGDASISGQRFDVLGPLPGRRTDFRSLALEAVAWSVTWGLAHQDTDGAQREKMVILADLRDALDLRSPIKGWAQGRNDQQAWPHELMHLDVMPADDLVPILERLVEVSDLRDEVAALAKVVTVRARAEAALTASMSAEDEMALGFEGPRP